MAKNESKNPAKEYSVGGYTFKTKEELNILWSLEQTAEKYEDRVAVSLTRRQL